MTDWHPLFPPNDDDDDPDGEPPDIQYILVQRKENGKYVTAPRSFMPNELPNSAALYAEFGGGEYQLVGRDSRHILRRRVLLQLPGNSKPMHDEGNQSQVKQPPPPPPQDPMSAMMGGMGPQGGFMGLIMMMMQNMMQQASQAAERQTQMMLAMMNNSSQMSTAQIAQAQEQARLQAERDRADKQASIELLMKLSEGRGNSNGSEDSFFKGVEFMRHFATQQIEVMKASASGKAKESEFDWESLLESGMQALQTFNAFKDMGTGIPGMPAAATEVGS